MSYHRKSTALTSLGDVASVASTAGSLLSDPYFSEAVCRVQQLRAIERKEAVPACSKTAPNLPGGIGLRPVMPPLRAYTSASSKPGKWPLYAAVAGVIGVPMFFGYLIGKGR